MKLINILLLFVLLSGCAGVGLVASDDPYTKLSQAHMLMGQVQEWGR